MESFEARFRTWGSILPCRRRLQSCRRQHSRSRLSNPSREHIITTGGVKTRFKSLPAADGFLRHLATGQPQGRQVFRAYITTLLNSHIRNKTTGIGKGGRNFLIFYFCMCPKPRIHKNLTAQPTAIFVSSSLIRYFMRYSLSFRDINN